MHYINPIKSSKFLSFIIFSLFVIQGCTQRNNANLETKYKFTNELVNETSPYLLQHAHNPVNWRPWNDETLQAAKDQNKLMVVSVGYAACHWCHVMEHESFEDEEVAALMNEYFICVKVDREQRPDVDDVYMTACQMMTGRGGWPLNAITLSDGRPVFAGTYFPKEQWVSILQQIVDMAEKDMNKLTETADNVTNGIQQSDVITVEKDDSFTKDGLNDIVGFLLSGVDYKNGGNNRTPRFPMPNNFELLLKYNWLTKDPRAVQAVNITLEKMGQGGIYDQLGGGFARYSVDGVWKVPHFEKMLYDNGQLIGLYSDAFKNSKEPYFKQIVEQTYDYLERETKDAKGAYYSSLDADSEGVEGKFYVWDSAELDSLLGADSEIYKDFYSCTKNGNWEHSNILHITKEPSQIAKKNDVSEDELFNIIGKANKQLLDERSKRIRPGLDDKVLCAWNGLAVDGLLRAYEAFGDQKYYAKADEILQFILTEMKTQDGRLLRTYKKGKADINGFLDDYALIIKALIKMYQCDFNEKWLDEASILTNIVMQNFHDENQDLFFFTSADDSPLIVRKTEYTDNVIPSSNSIMAKNLFDLGNLVYNTEWIERSKSMLALINPNLKEKTNGSFFTNWIQNSMDMVHAPFEIVIVGENAEVLRKELSTNYLGNSIILGSESDSDLALLKDKYQEGDTFIYVCQNKTCKYPVKTVDEALKLLIIP